MIATANKKIRESRDTVAKKILNGVSDFGTYKQLVGEWKAFNESLAINVETSKLDEDADADS